MGAALTVPTAIQLTTVPTQRRDPMIESWSSMTGISKQKLGTVFTPQMRADFNNLTDAGKKAKMLMNALKSIGTNVDITSQVIKALGNGSFEELTDNLELSVRMYAENSTERRTDPQYFARYVGSKYFIVIDAGSDFGTANINGFRRCAVELFTKPGIQRQIHNVNDWNELCSIAQEIRGNNDVFNALSVEEKYIVGLLHEFRKDAADRDELIDPATHKLNRKGIEALESRISALVAQKLYSHFMVFDKRSAVSVLKRLQGQAKAHKDRYENATHNFIMNGTDPDITSLSEGRITSAAKRLSNAVIGHNVNEHR